MHTATKQPAPCMSTVSDADVASNDAATRDRDSSSHLDDTAIDAGVASDDAAVDGTAQGFTGVVAAFVRTFPHAPIVLLLSTACMIFVICDDAPSLSADINTAGEQRLRSQQVIISSLLQLLNITSQHDISGLETIRAMRLTQGYMSTNYGFGGLPELQEFASAYEQNPTNKHQWATSVIRTGSGFLQVADKNVKTLEVEASRKSTMHVFFIIGLCCMEVVAIGALAWTTPRRNWLDKIDAARALYVAVSSQAEAERQAKAYQTITSILSHDLRGVSSNGLINIDLLRNILDESRLPEGSCITLDPVTSEMVDTLMTRIVSDNTHVQYAVRSVQMTSDIINQTEHHMPANEDFDLVHLSKHFMTLYPTVRLEEITTPSSIFRGDEVAIPLFLLLP